MGSPETDGKLSLADDVAVKEKTGRIAHRIRPVSMYLADKPKSLPPQGLARV
jgi:hypothetical protein